MNLENQLPENPHWKMSVDDLVNGAEGKLISHVARNFCGVGTDTRADLKNKVFVALKGDTFDAHDYLQNAVDAGATALLVHRLTDEQRDPQKGLMGRVTIVQVSDTLKAFQLLGNYWRQKMRARVVGITGTNGKTTTKEFAAAVIGSKYKVQYSKGSFNNHWGVPMSLLSIDTTHEVALVEMGMNHPGELKDLDAIAEPDVVACTMVGRGHLEGLGSIEGVAKAKAEIYDFAPAQAMRIYNLENEHTRKMYEKAAAEIAPSLLMTFSGKESNPSAWPKVDVGLRVVQVLPDSLRIRGEIQGVGGETTVPVFGRQNANNLMVAACCALACGLTPAEVWAALPLCKTVWGRNQWVQLEGGARVLFDGYNANPESTGAALENFAAIEPAAGGRKFAVLGEMLELGSQAAELHREIGEKAARAGFAAISFFGPHAAEFRTGLTTAGFENSLFVSDSYEQSLAPKTLPVLNVNDIVLIKGSRGMALEKVLADLRPMAFSSVQAKK